MAAIIVTAAAASAAAGLGASFIHVELASAYLLAIQPFNSFFRFAVIRHFHEAEPARPSGEFIGDNSNAVYLSKRLKPRPELVFIGAEAEIAYKNLLHTFPFARQAE